jgi:hypothetical protein
MGGTIVIQCQLMVIKRRIWVCCFCSLFAGYEHNGFLLLTMLTMFVVLLWLSFLRFVVFALCFHWTSIKEGAEVKDKYS